VHVLAPTDDDSKPTEHCVHAVAAAAE